MKLAGFVERRIPLSETAPKSFREEHSQTILPAQALAAEAAQLERQVSDLVNEAYGLTPDEIALMWKTAPPRMPLRSSDRPEAGPGKQKL